MTVIMSLSDKGNLSVHFRQYTRSENDCYHCEQMHHDCSALSTLFWCLSSWNVRITRSFENMRSLRSLSLLTLCSNWHHHNAIFTFEYSQKGYVEHCLWMASLWDPVLQNNSLHLNLQHVQCESVLFCVCFPTSLCNLVHQLHHSVLIHTSVCSGHTANPKCVKLGN